MSNRIKNCFANCKKDNRAAFIAYATIGCPNLEESESFVDELINNGCDIVELGVPFSDPMADGIVIQEASQMALQNGTNFVKVLELAKRIRHRHTDTPLVIFSYFNVLFNYGLERLGDALASAGIDGILVVDLPLEESSEITSICREYELDFIPLVAVTTPLERVQKIVNNGSGFLYTITHRGVTGTTSSLPADLSSSLQTVREISHLPIAAGFGISTPEMAKSIAQSADAVVVGSALMKSIISNQKNEALNLAKKIRQEI